MTSREEAEVLSNAINGLVKDFERMGFDRGQIGASLAGIGLGLAQVHLGHDRAMEMVNRLSDCLMSDASGLQ
jgi:DMSO reductase anchor subunit